MIYEVYALIDSAGRVLNIDGGVTIENVDKSTWVKIDEGADAEKYGGCQQHYVEMPLYTMDTMIPRYKMVDGEIVLRSDDEIAGDVVETIPEPSVSDRVSDLEDLVAVLTEVICND